MTQRVEMNIALQVNEQALSDFKSSRSMNTMWSTISGGRPFHSLAMVIAPRSSNGLTLGIRCSLVDSVAGSGGGNRKSPPVFSSPPSIALRKRWRVRPADCRSTRVPGICYRSLNLRNFPILSGLQSGVVSALTRVLVCNVQRPQRGGTARDARLAWAQHRFGGPSHPHRLITTSAKPTSGRRGRHSQSLMVFLVLNT